MKTHSKEIVCWLGVEIKLKLSYSKKQKKKKQKKHKKFVARVQQRLLHRNDEVSGVLASLTRVENSVGKVLLGVCVDYCQTFGEVSHLRRVIFSQSSRLGWFHQK